MRILIAAMALLVAARVGVAQEAALPPGVNAAAEVTVLKSAEAIRALPTARGAEGLPVELEGVVTWRSGRRNHAIIVYDGKMAIWASLRGARLTGDGPPGGAAPGYDPGEVGPRGYAPVVVAEELRMLGKGPLPEPNPAASRTPPATPRGPF